MFVEFADELGNRIENPGQASPVLVGASATSRARTTSPPPRRPVHDDRSGAATTPRCPGKSEIKVLALVWTITRERCRRLPGPPEPAGAATLGPIRSEHRGPCAERVDSSRRVGHRPSADPRRFRMSRRLWTPTPTSGNPLGPMVACRTVGGLPHSILPASALASLSAGNAPWARGDARSERRRNPELRQNFGLTAYCAVPTYTRKIEPDNISSVAESIDELGESVPCRREAPRSTVQTVCDPRLKLVFNS